MHVLYLIHIISAKGYIESALAFLKPDFMSGEAAQALAIYCSALFTWERPKTKSPLGLILNSIRLLGMHSPIMFLTLSLTELAFWSSPHLQPQGQRGIDMVQCQHCGVRGSFAKVRVFDSRPSENGDRIFFGPVIQCSGCKSFVVHNVFPARPSLDSGRAWGPWFKWPGSPEWIGCREETVVEGTHQTRALVVAAPVRVPPPQPTALLVRDAGAYKFGKPVVGAAPMRTVDVQ